VLVYIDGQAVVVPKSSNITTLAGLDKKTVCILNGTPYGPRITEWFAERHLSIEPVTFETQPALYEAFFGGKCSSLTQDISALASTVVASGKAADYLMLPEIIAQDPLGAFVRDNDEEWSNVVRWTLYALQEAEAYGITSGNATTLRDSGVPRIKRLLGAERGVGEPLGLDDAWVYNMIQRDLRAQRRLLLTAQIWTRHQRTVEQRRHHVPHAGSLTEHDQAADRPL
jgi:general L-amino acid transport system substrate-binding protein